MNLFSAKNGQYLQDCTARVPRKTLVFSVPLISWLLKGKSIDSEKLIKKTDETAREICIHLTKH